jgi:hypothetical protein
MASPRDSTTSSDSEDLPDLRSTPEGIAAQAAVARLDQRVPTGEYAAFLAQFTASHESLRARPGPRGRRFQLF